MADRSTEMDDSLNDPQMARISTTRADGSPYVIPLCHKFNPDDGTFFISTGADSVTVKI